MRKSVDFKVVKQILHKIIAIKAGCSVCCIQNHAKNCGEKHAHSTRTTAVIVKQDLTHKP